MPIRLKPIAGQIVVITGATSGIGLAIAEAASGAGARLMLAARNQEALDDVRDRLEARGGDVAVTALDVADADYAQRLVEATRDRFGGLDTWVNNAAAATYGTLAETPIEDQRRVFEVGYWGTINGSLVALEALRGRGGAIINIGSVLSARAMILQGPYSAMKHAVKGFTDALRTEVMEAGYPVSVTLIKPAAMNTPYPEHARNRMDGAARLPPVLYDPRLVARAVLFAAENTRREITVGGFGAAAVAGDVLMPGLIDRAMAAFGRPAQQTDQSPPPGREDNLYEAREDGVIESAQNRTVRRQSLWLEAQLRPWASLGIMSASLGVLGVGIAGLRRKR